MRARLLRRRRFLHGVGALTVTGAAGGFLRARPDASRAENSTEIGEGAEFEPWRNWHRDPHEGAVGFIRAGILAANAFNTQPWLFKIDRARIELYADQKRNLGTFDLYLREMHLSLGCALENILLAAAAGGFRSSLALAPGKLELPSADKLRPTLVARIDLGPAPPLVSELYDAIPHRHTSREPFDANKALPDGFIEALARLTAGEEDVKLFLFTELAERKKLAAWMQQASTTLLADPSVQRGLQPWIRRTAEEWRQARDGELMTPDTGGSKGPEAERELLLSGRLFGVIAVHDRYDRPQTLRAGGLWQRCHLLATAWGLAARPYNSIIDAMDQDRRSHREPHYASLLGEVTGDASWQPTLMFYMGHPTVPVRASPRRAVTEVELPTPGQPGNKQTSPGKATVPRQNPSADPDSPPAEPQNPPYNSRIP